VFCAQEGGRFVWEGERVVSSAIQTEELHDGLGIPEHGTHESSYGLVWLLHLLLFGRCVALDGGQGLA